MDRPSQNPNYPRRTQAHPPAGADERAAIARSLQEHTRDPEGVVARSSASTENEASNVPVPDFGIPLPFRTRPVNRPSSATTDADHARGNGPGRVTAPDGSLSARLDRLAVTSRFAEHLALAPSGPAQRPTITAHGSPSLIARVSTDDGVPATRVNTPAGHVAPVGHVAPAGATTAEGTDSARTSSTSDASSNASTRGSPVDPSIADDTIVADGALPAAGGVPAVGTMPAVGRVAYITVQSPDNRFYTVRVDLTDAAPNSTYNITINIPPP